MINDTDVKKIMKAMKDVFPTAEIVEKSFDGTASRADIVKLATKEQVEKIDLKLTKVESKLNSVLSEEIESLKQRVRVLENALEI